MRILIERTRAEANEANARCEVTQSEAAGRRPTHLPLAVPVSHEELVSQHAPFSRGQAPHTPLRVSCISSDLELPTSKAASEVVGEHAEESQWEAHSPAFVLTTRFSGATREEYGNVRDVEMQRGFDKLDSFLCARKSAEGARTTAGCATAHHSAACAHLERRRGPWSMMHLTEDSGWANLCTTPTVAELNSSLCSSSSESRASSRASRTHALCWDD